jgi:hypothetical protein
LEAGDSGQFSPRTDNPRDKKSCSGPDLKCSGWNAAPTLCSFGPNVLSSQRSAQVVGAITTSRHAPKSKESLQQSSSSRLAHPAGPSKSQAQRGGSTTPCSNTNNRLASCAASQRSSLCKRHFSLTNSAIAMSSQAEIIWATRPENATPFCIQNAPLKAIMKTYLFPALFRSVRPRTRKTKILTGRADCIRPNPVLL